MCGFKSHLPHQKRTPPWGRSFLVPRGAHAPCKNLVCALIEREGRTRRWSSLHTSLPLRGGRLVRFGPGRSFLVQRGAHGFLQRAGNCPDGTRKTTLTVFFHTIFPSGGEGFFVGAGRLFYFVRKIAGSTWIFTKGGGLFIGRERAAGPERNGFLFTKFTIFICKMSEDFTCGIY